MLFRLTQKSIADLRDHLFRYISYTNQSWYRQARFTYLPISLVMVNFLGTHHYVIFVTSQVEEEAEHKAELQRQLSKINAEAQMWKTKYENDGLAR